MRKSFLLRIDPDLWADLEVWARDDLRSVNAQIEYLLRQAVARRKGGRGATPSASVPSSPAEEPSHGPEL